jgi:hypothetical protein
MMANAAKNSFFAMSFLLEQQRWRPRAFQY